MAYLAYGTHLKNCRYAWVCDEAELRTRFTEPYVIAKIRTWPWPRNVCELDGFRSRSLIFKGHVSQRSYTVICI
jgi:hypothetical protein